jgi:hypothetical protein
VALACCRPLPSLVRACQPSSRIRYSYPAFASPEETNVAAVGLIMLSLMLALKVFQLFQPEIPGISELCQDDLSTERGKQTWRGIQGCNESIALTHLRLSGCNFATVTSANLPVTSVSGAISCWGILLTICKGNYSYH